jgi:hypothetical protein
MEEKILPASDSSALKYVDLFSELIFGVDSRCRLVKRTLVQRQAVDNFTPIRK